MPEHGWCVVNRRGLLCLIIGTAGLVAVPLGACFFDWRPAIALPAMVLLGAVPLAAAAWTFLLAGRRLGNQLHQSRRAGEVGRLAGDVAHDFNNLLAEILGAAEVLGTRVGETGVEREMVNAIITASRQAGQLSSRLLVAAKNHADTAVPLDLQALNREMSIAPTATGAHLPRGRGLILLVDDEAAIRALASMVLVQLGYEVIVASSGAKGIELYTRERERIDAVVLDMVMPDMDGLEVLRELKRINPRVRVAIAAGYIPEKTRPDLEAAGAAAIILKPYRMNEIGTVLAGILGTDNHL